MTCVICGQLGGSHHAYWYEHRRILEAWRSGATFKGNIEDNYPTAHERCVTAVLKWLANRMSLNKQIVKAVEHLK